MEPIVSFSDLLELQKVDTTVDQLVRDRRSLPELEEYQRARQVAREAARAAEEATTHLRSLDRDLARAEDDLQMTEEKLAAQERRLFAGGMSARETENLRTEVASLRRKVSSLEDELLEMLDQREEMQEKEKSLGEGASSTAVEERRLAGRITKARGVIDVSLDRHRQRREEIVTMVVPRLLDLYQRLRKRRGGVVVGKVSDRVCGACHLQMSVAEYEDVLEDPVPQCINCAAILVT